jgi:hypothetical protein
MGKLKNFVMSVDGNDHIPLRNISTFWSFQVVKYMLRSKLFNKFFFLTKNG